MFYNENCVLGRSACGRITGRGSRFGIRKIFLNDEEKPSIKSYMNPGRAYHGTR